MSRSNYDGVIEAVRYSPNGQIDMVRVYERRWLVYSDHILLDRATLLERLSQGKSFVTGQRKAYVANVFETGKSVHLSGISNPIITTKDQAGSQDFLANVPVF
ncbi:MAG: hypothetical protein A2X25_05860 [Chloroflexi bacterium GWB2_49_20]|nr:MAG: hypothetical protein A2X25_05860 [Chloroflexi bacterium GWB2_49_20]OGN77147.1 MAG: hypothetical protein A2X26_06860 [Chloroflexi bacterium GWC2_49_37]OGN83873.1 MAG: hypothetical protein A2X27_02465 [Chloroflexi bacterium GWD2_49_16]